jgi:hypothetical protein
MESDNWCLYYTNQSTFTDNDGAWLEAPAWKIAALAIRNPLGGRWIDGLAEGFARDGGVVGCGDYYIWLNDSDHPWRVDCGGLFDYLIDEGVMHTGGTLEQISPDVLIGAGVKFGRNVNDGDWPSLAEWIVADADERFGKGTNAARKPAPPISG